MNHNLNENEKKVLPTLSTLLNKGIPKSELIYWTIVCDNQVAKGQPKINWMKVALQLDSKILIDTIFDNQKVRQEDIDEAISFGATQPKPPKYSTLDRIAINMVETEYEVKHTQQSPSSNLPDSMKKYPSLSTLEYLSERIKDVFKKNSDKQNKVLELREKFSAEKNNQSTIKPN